MRLSSLLALFFAASSCVVPRSQGGATARGQASPPLTSQQVASQQLSNKIASAAIGTGLAIAAAGINRAITKDCWATCPTGTRCDKAAGVCVALPCRNRCPADERCAIVEGRETCVRGTRDVAVGSDEIPPLEETPGDAAPAGGDDPCRGLCFPGEQCVEKGGVADCVPRGSAQGRGQ